jgi:hypothetical protein
MFPAHLYSDDFSVYPAFLAPPFGTYRTDLGNQVVSTLV